MLPRSLRARLLVAFLAVAAAALGTVGIAVLLVGPGYFADAMGHLPGDPMGEAMAIATLAAFTDAMRQALIAATITAVAASVVVSIAVTARIARPVTRLASAARRVAHGDYADRVSTDEPGELGELAASFNEMAGSLEATERRRLQLVGDVAHELRTPLTTLDGYLEGLEDGVIAPTAQTWHLLRGETARLTRLVDDLAELWRAEARQLPLKLEPLDVAEVAREVVERSAPLARPRGIELAVSTSRATQGGGRTAGATSHADHGDPLTAIADRDRLAQIVSNYLSNALRHAPDGSRVTIRVAPIGGDDRDGTIRLSVSDEGPGLSPDQVAAVFERFYRVDPARSRAAGGAGIGLAIVRALAEAMGGAAWAESAGAGRGATFHLELPRA